MMKLRRWVLTATMGLMALGTTACGGSKSAAHIHYQATPRPVSTAPVIPGACPPGCSLASDHDAITVLASSAEQVAIVTVRNEQGPAPAPTLVESVKTLQGNVVNDDPQTPLSVGQVRNLGSKVTLIDGMSYLVFMSFSRGGPCMSAAFSYDAATQVATFVESDDGPDVPQLPFTGRTLLIPRTITLAEARARMYPTGGVVFPTDTGEGWCPGP